MQVTFCGYKVLYTYERFAWIPIVMVYLVALGCGGKHLAYVGHSIQPMSNPD